VGTHFAPGDVARRPRGRRTRISLFFDCACEPAVPVTPQPAERQIQQSYRHDRRSVPM